MHRLVRILLLLTPCGLVSPVPAQGAVDDGMHPPAAAGSAVRCELPLVPIHTQADDDGVAYGTWAAGPGYKASFHEGATFVPYLGRDYPMVQSLRWQTLSVRCGEHELVDGRRPRLSTAGLRAEYDLGGVVEAYDVRRDGLEQTFVVAKRPTGSGDLVIRGAIESALRADAVPVGHHALVFRDAAGRAIASYGAATAVDAAGRRCAMTTEIVGGAVTLRLDGAWLAEASFPIVVDPLFGVFFMMLSARLEGYDIAHDGGGITRNLWQAHELFTAAGESDLYVYRTDADGTNMGLAFQDLTTSWSTEDPSIGIHEYSGNVVTAFSRYFPATDTIRLRFHKHARGALGAQTHYASIATGSHNAWRPDVAFDLQPFALSQLLVVFQREGTGTFANVTTSDIYGVTLDLAGTSGTAGAPFAIADAPFEDFERPCIGRVMAGDPARWTVANQVIGNGALYSPHVTWDVELRRVDRAGNVLGPTTIGGSTGEHETMPRLGGFGDVQMVAWLGSDPAVVGSRPAGENGMELWVSRREWNGSQYAGLMSRTLTVNNDARIVMTGLDADRNTRSHYGLTYRSTVTDNVYFGWLGGDSNPLAQVLVYGAGALNAADGGVAFDEDHDRFVIGYCANDNFGAGAVYLDRWDYPTAPPVVHSGLGCSTAQIGWLGSQLMGDENCGVELTGVAAGAPAVVLVAAAPYSFLLTGTPLVHPGCWLLVPNTGAGSMATLPLRLGPDPSWNIRLPSWMPPMTLYLQGAHFDGNLSEVFTTDRLTVPLIR